MNDKFLPYSRPVITDDDVAAVADSLRDVMISQGTRLRELEESFARTVSARWAVAASNGTAAVHAMCHAAGIGPGDDVVLPALTFAGTANAVRYVGARPVFADVRPDTYCLDPASVEHVATERTRAILTVDFAGHPSEYETLRQVCSRRGARLLADAAHAPGARFRGREIGGELADMTAFSLNPVKNITAAEGGLVTGSDPSFREAAIRFVRHGMTRDASLFEHPEYADQGWYYEQQTLGFNYKLSELHAALACSQLKRLREHNAHRAQIAAYYADALDPDLLHLPTVAPGMLHAWHLYVVRVRDGGASRRNRLFAALRAAGIGVQLHYIPVPLHPDYRRAGLAPDNGLAQLPVTMEYYDTALSLPVHPAMDESDASRVVDTIATFFATLGNG